MECIRCKENPTVVTDQCLRFRRSTHTDANPFAGSKTVTTYEFSEGTETVGLCERCIRKIALREPQVLFPKLYTRFYLIWGIAAAAAFVLLGIAACGKRGTTNVPGAVSLIGMMTLLLAAGVFELTVRLLGAYRRTNRDKRLIARAGKYPYKGIYSKTTYVPLDGSLYPDRATFDKVNSELLSDNKKKVYERIIVPMQSGGIPTFPTGWDDLINKS